MEIVGLKILFIWGEPSFGDGIMCRSWESDAIGLHFGS